MHKTSLVFLASLIASSHAVMAQTPLPPTPADWVYQNPTPGGEARVVASGDVNGDGFDDLLISEPGYTAVTDHEGRVMLFFGSAAGPSTTPGWSVSGAAPGAQIFARGPVGDLDGDGYDEILLSDGRLYLGSSAGPASSPVQTGIVTFATAAGDVNGDGYGDLAVGRAGGVDIYHGSAAGLPATPSWIVTGLIKSPSPVLEDVTGDGYDDLILAILEPPPGNQKYSFGTATLHVWKGGPAGLEAKEMRAPRLPGPEQTATLAGAGDADGDGYGDLIAGMYCRDAASCSSNPPLVALYGSKSGLHEGADPGLKATLLDSVPVAGLGDVNGDGYDDVAVGVHSPDEANRRVLLILLGSESGLDPVPAVLRGEIPDSFGEDDGFADGVAGAGDVNGDGYADIVVTAPWWPSATAVPHSGRVSLFYGRPGLAPGVSAP